jgi:hypothetical protein
VEIDWGASAEKIVERKNAASIAVAVWDSDLSQREEVMIRLSSRRLHARKHNSILFRNSMSFFVDVEDLEQKSSVNLGHSPHKMLSFSTRNSHSNSGGASNGSGELSR